MVVDGELPVVTQATVDAAFASVALLGQDPDEYFLSRMAESNPVLHHQIVEFAHSLPPYVSAVTLSVAGSVYALLAAQAKADDANDAERDM